MKKTILTYGLISGVIGSVLMSATLPFENRLGHGHAAEVLGYTTIVLSLLLVFFGIRSYRDNLLGGRITFGRAFGVGLAITVLSCLFYVATWEVIYFRFMPDFMDRYGAAQIERSRAAGASPAALAAQAEQMKHYKALYDNPLYNAGLTFLEPFPVGLVITLVSAAVLRRRTPAEAASEPLPVR